MDNRCLSVDEIAGYLGVSKDTIYAWGTAKEMPGYKVGRFCRIKRDAEDTPSPIPRRTQT
jgi:excisionase family DNA binding protein